MRILVAEKLSPHKYKTPEGYLICQDAILARTGKQTYLNREVYGDSIDNPDKEIEIDRPEAEVFSDKTLASFENKPVTIEHPDEDVNIDNHNFYSVGFVRDIKRGIDDGKPVMIGTLVVTNPDAVADIEDGKLLELSCGYDCDIVDNAQTNIRGNHVALCEHGRAGNARIIDSATSFRKDMSKGEKSMNSYDDDLSYYRAGIIDSKFKDFDDTTKNIRVVKEFIEQNGNKFNKRKDADAILEYIKKRTGIANADYDDVLYIIKEYTRAEITDSVKDVSEREFDNILDLFERKGIDYSDADDELKYIWFRNNAMYDKAVQELRRQRYSFNEAINKRGVKLLKLDSMKDANHLPAKVKRDLQKFLNHKSTFIRNKDYDISEFAKEFERVSRLWAEFPLKIVRESIKGWFKTGDGMMRKDYTFSIEGYDDHFIVSLYAKPDTYETTELNAYFTDSVKDRQSSKLDNSCKDFVKDAKFEICYIDNGDVCITIEAKDENDARQKFRRRYGMYYIERIRKVKDSVKDVKYVIMHPRKNLYLTVGAKAWSDESSPMIKKFDSEKEAEEYAKKNTSDFRIAVFDSVKDMIDCDTNDRQVKDDEKTILFELLTKYGFKILRQGKTWSGRTHIEFAGDFFDEDDRLRVFSEAKKKIDRLDSEAARAGLRMTFNIGLGKDRVVGSIDSEPMHDSTYSEVTNELKSELKDENLFAQKALKAIKTIKMIK